MPDPPPLGTGDPAQIGTSRLTGVLGRGGQGSVYLGVASNGQNVAVKVLHEQMMADAKARMRFIREAEIAQRVAAFCTAQVLDVGFEANRPYVVSEYIAGRSLQRLVAEDGPRVGSSLDRLAVTTLTALAAIHRAGIIHRDFKPGNVIMGPEGPVVIDFGIARFADHQSTTGSAIVGTPAYIAPEQIAHQPAGAGADVFAWAATIVFAATGQVAFGGGGALPAVIHAVLNEDPDISGVPGRLRPLLAAALAKQPEARPSVVELLATLTNQGGAGREPAPRPPRPPVTPTRPPAAVDYMTLPADATELMASNQPTRVVPPLGQPVGPGFTGHTAAVTALAVHTTGQRQVVVSADLDHTLHAWDLTTAQPVGRPMRGHADRITEVLIAEVEGHPVVVSCDWSERVKTWDLTTGVGLQDWDEVGEVVTVSRWDERAVLVGGRGAVVEVFDLGTGALMCRPLTIPFYRHDPDAHPVVARLAVAELDGHPVIVAGSHAEAMLRCAVWVFDLATGDRVLAPRRPVGGSVELMDVVQHDDELLGIVYGRVPGLRRWAIRAWNLTTGQEPVRLRQPATFRRATEAMAVVHLDGGPAVVAAGADRALHLWDLVNGNRIGGPLRCDQNGITALAVTRIAGHPVGVTGGADGSVRAWSLAP